VGDNPFPIVSQSVIELETAEGALLRRAGKESQMAEEVTGVLPHRRLWISSLIVGGKESYQQQSACSRKVELPGFEVSGYRFSGACQRTNWKMAGNQVIFWRALPVFQLAPKSHAQAHVALRREVHAPPEAWEAHRGERGLLQAFQRGPGLGDLRQLGSGILEVAQEFLVGLEGLGLLAGLFQDFPQIELR
jgi:hypothetical protein